MTSTWQQLRLNKRIPNQLSVISTRGWGGEGSSAVYYRDERKWVLFESQVNEMNVQFPFKMGIELVGPFHMGYLKQPNISTIVIKLGFYSSVLDLHTTFTGILYNHIQTLDT